MAVSNREVFSLLSGDAFIKPLSLATGDVSGEILTSCVDIFQITPEATSIPVVCKSRGKYLQTAETFTLAGTSTLSITLKNTQPALLAITLLGQALETTIPALTIVAGTIDVTNCGWQPIGGRADTFTIAGSVLDTDYIVDLDAGYWQPIIGGNLAGGTDAVPLTVTFDAAAAAYDVCQIDINSLPNLEACIDWFGEDLKSGKKYKFSLPRVALSADTAIDWLSETPIDVVLTGTILSSSVNGTNLVNYLQIDK